MQKLADLVRIEEDKDDDNENVGDENVTPKTIMFNQLKDILASCLFCWVELGIFRMREFGLVKVGNLAYTDNDKATHSGKLHELEEKIKEDGNNVQVKSGNVNAQQDR